MEVAGQARGEYTPLQNERPGPNTWCLTLNYYGAIKKAEILESARLPEVEARERLRVLGMIFST